MKDKLHVGFDIGTTGMRAYVMDGYAMQNGRFDIETMEERFYELLCSIADNVDNEKVESISIASIGSSTIIMDESMNPINIQGGNVRTFKDTNLDFIVKDSMKDHIGRTTTTVGSHLSLPIYHVKDFQEANHNPNIKVGDINSYLTHLMTGRHANSGANLSLTGFMNMQTLKLDEDLLQWAGIKKDTLPEWMYTGVGIDFNPKRQFSNFKFKNAKVFPGVLDGLAPYFWSGRSENQVTLKLESTMAARIGTYNPTSTPETFAYPLVWDGKGQYFVQGNASNNGAQVFDKYMKAHYGDMSQEEFFKKFENPDSEIFHGKIPQMMYVASPISERDGKAPMTGFYDLNGKSVEFDPNRGAEFFDAAAMSVMSNLRTLYENLKANEVGNVWATGVAFSNSEYIQNIASGMFPFNISYNKGDGNADYTNAQAVAALPLGLSQGTTDYSTIKSNPALQESFGQYHEQKKIVEKMVRG